MGQNSPHSPDIDHNLMLPWHVTRISVYNVKYRLVLYSVGQLA